MRKSEEPSVDTVSSTSSTVLYATWPSEVSRPETGARLLTTILNGCTQLCVGVHTFKIIRYGMVPVFFIRFRYSNGTDTGYFLYWSMFSIRFCRARYFRAEYRYPHGTAVPVWTPNYALYSIWPKSAG